MGIPLGRAPISTMELAEYILTTQGDATRRVEKGELKDYLDSLDYCLDTGTANTYVITPTIPITAYEAGQTYKFKALNTNTGASTINISGVGTKSLVKSGNVALAAGDIPKDAIITTIYDGVNFQIVPDYSAQLSEKANQTDSNRTTTDKTVTGAINELNSGKANLAATPQKTITDKTYYVNASTGADTNDGLTSGTAFKTFAKAVSMIPQIVNHNYIIQCSAGTYDTLNLNGFNGYGSIKILGDTTISANYMINGTINVRNNYCSVYIRGFKANTINIGFNLYSNINVQLDYCVCDYAGGSTGIACAFGFYTISNCSASNRAIALSCDTAIVSSQNWGNTSNNTIGLNCGVGGTIGKMGTQPIGVTAENAYYGGVIR